jgi:hypothetical protein
MQAECQFKSLFYATGMTSVALINIKHLLGSFFYRVVDPSRLSAVPHFWLSATKSDGGAIEMDNAERTGSIPI